MTSKTAEMSVDAVSLSRTRSLHAVAPPRSRRARHDPDRRDRRARLGREVRGVASPHTTPRYFPDEYLYSALARSLAHGSLQIRGEPAHFPALLESIVTAPVWLTGGIELPFRLVQLVHAIVAALAVVPVFAVARRLGPSALAAALVRGADTPPTRVRLRLLPHSGRARARLSRWLPSQRASERW